MVRRFEAAGFRAWPAETVAYDGAWVIRLTRGHPAKRLNSVNPLDPGDATDVAGRIERAAARFAEAGRPLTFRLSPLAGPHLTAFFDQRGWSRLSESVVMRARLADAPLDEAMSQIPFRDMARFVEAASALNGVDAAERAGLLGIVERIEPETGLFALQRSGRPIATAICVHDGDLAGLFEIATDALERGRGHGRRIVMSALKWARSRGAREGWLQVEADNVAAIGLYEQLGFSEIYRYHYRRPPGA
ncbi:MAG: GNAT family N-acetyltransferase [Rhizobiaceae bacterium]|nr:GNAT family N-acetyltransferase [Rhizobiaceae bacterium]MCV0408354.1 GNAT family N-acetyltransferase [Rhizobiaceae bacterium]